MAETYDYLARRQHGVVSRPQLLRLGLTDEGIEWRLRSRRLIRLHWGVYSVSTSGDGFHRRFLAAVLAAGGRAAASHRAAALLLELGHVEAPIEISVPNSQRPRIRGVTVYRPAHFPRAHVTRRNGIPVTTAVRTVCDLAHVLDRTSLARILDDGLNKGRFDVKGVAEVVRALPRDPQRRMLRLLACRPEGRALSDSVLEEWFQDFLERVKIEGWVPLYPLPLENGITVHIDVAFPAERVALEIDGFITHAGRMSFDKDADRRGEIVAAGWRILTVTHAQLDTPDVLESRIRRTLASTVVPISTT